MFRITFLFGIYGVLDVYGLRSDIFGNHVDDNKLDENEEHKTVRFIYPGTKWCGVGNVANEFDDLGFLSSTDKCCRAHDNCDEFIDGFQTKYNLTNEVFYTRLSCTCDMDFYKCLKSIDKIESKTIGNIYFNGLGTKCFKNDYMVRGCNKYSYFPIKKCLVYDFVQNSKMTYQWFDLPTF